MLPVRSPGSFFLKKNIKYVLNGSFILRAFSPCPFYPFLMLKDIDSVKCSNLLLSLWMQIVMLLAFYGAFLRCLTLYKEGKCCLPYFTGGKLWCLHCGTTELGKVLKPPAGILHFQVISVSIFMCLSLSKSFTTSPDLKQSALLLLKPKSKMLTLDCLLQLD